MEQLRALVDRKAAGPVKAATPKAAASAAHDSSKAAPSPQPASRAPLQPKNSEATKSAFAAKAPASKAAEPAGPKFIQIRQADAQNAECNNQ